MLGEKVKWDACLEMVVKLQKLNGKLKPIKFHEAFKISAGDRQRKLEIEEKIGKSGRKQLRRGLKKI